MRIHRKSNLGLFKKNFFSKSMIFGSPPFPHSSSLFILHLPSSPQRKFALPTLSKIIPDIYQFSNKASGIIREKRSDFFVNTS